MPLIWFCIAFALGIVWGDQLLLPALPSVVAALSLIAGGAICWRQPDVRLPLLLAAAFVLGVARIAYAQPVTTEQSVWSYTGYNITLIGTIEQQPDRREDKQTAVLTAERLVIDQVERAVTGKVILKLPPNPELTYGQQLRIEGTLEQPRSGDDFDYRAYLARHGIHALMNQPKLTLLPNAGGSPWQRTMLALNDDARRTGLHLISEPHASLLVGILLGVQSTIPDDVLDAFSATGTSHILVISGWNISIIITSLASVLATVGVSRKRAAAISLPLIALYVLFVGVSPSVVRAAVMGSLAVIAMLVDRESEAWTSLAVASVGMAALDPNVLWDIGFQLSALATAGLFAFARPIEGWLSARSLFRWRLIQWTIEPLTATIAASALALPIILYHFGRLSLIAPLANVLMLPAVPYVMLFGSLATVAGMIWLPLGQALALLTWPFLQWLLLCARWLAQVPGAYTTLPPFAIEWVWAYYGLIAGLVAWMHWRRSTRTVSAAVPNQYMAP